MQLIFLAAVRLVVGRLGCSVDRQGKFFVVDKSKCWTGDMNAVFNVGNNLQVAVCNEYGWV